jgi:methionine synthase II (cobalamin-independent)
LKLGITDNRKSLGIAFAIAKKHKKVGMPVAGPTKFIQKTIDATDADIERFAEDWAQAIFEAQINAIIENIRP